MRRVSYRLLLLPLLMLGLAACQDDAQEVAAPTYETYGEAFEPVGTLPMQAVVAEPEKYADGAVTLEGTVHEVCQNMGCWLTLQDAEGRTVRVKVPRDTTGAYVYTVPTDLSGRRVVVQGTIREVTHTAEEKRHLAEDAGETPPDDDFQDTSELQLTASGVLVQKTTP